MREEQIQSVAFRNAELGSERLRIFGVIGFFAIFILVTLVRVFVIRTVSGAASWRSLLLAVVVIGYELSMLRKVQYALRASAVFSRKLWVLNTIVETSIPAFAIAFLTDLQIDISYRPLASPAVLVFFVFIVLSTLRLSRWIGVLSGVVASCSYLGAAVYLGWRPPVVGIATHVTQSAVSLNAMTLLIGGIVAGLVAGEIRKYVRAALREAETRQKLEVVQHYLQVARSIQQSFLPQATPNIAGFEIAGWDLPAASTGGHSLSSHTLAPVSV